MQNAKDIILNAFVLGMFLGLTACPESQVSGPLKSNLPGSGGATPTAAIPQFSIQPDSAVGWQESGSSYKIKLQPQTGSATFQCRLTKGPGPGTGSFSSCGVTNGPNVEVDASALPGAGPDGGYFFEVKAVNLSVESSVVEKVIYFHTSLNNLTKCNVGIDPQPYFNEAATYLSMADNFGSSTNLINPNLKVQFADGGIASPLSLRHRLVLNSDRTLLMIYRVYESKQRPGSCDQHVATYKHSDCTAFIFNADGEGLCVRNLGGGVVHHDNISPHDRFENVRSTLYNPYESNQGRRKMFSFKEKNPNDFTQFSWVTYLPD